MLLTCNNCLKMNESKLDVATHKVICAECNKEMSSITETMKRVLKSSGQIVREEGRKAFVMACHTCNVHRQVVLNSNNESVCKVCSNPIKVHASMLLAIKEAGLRLVEQNKDQKVMPATEVKASKKKAKARKSKAVSNQ